MTQDGVNGEAVAVQVVVNGAVGHVRLGRARPSVHVGVVAGPVERALGRPAVGVLGDVHRGPLVQGLAVEHVRTGATTDGGVLAATSHAADADIQLGADVVHG